MDSANLYQQVIASLNSGVIVVGGDGIIASANPAACDHLGAPPELLRAGVPLSELADKTPFFSAMSEIMAAGRSVSREEITLDTPSGPRVIGVSASLLDTPDDSDGTIFLFTDLTEARRFEREAAVNRQLAEIGQLTAGVVHELRNPVSVISGMSELLMRKLDAHEPQFRWADSIFQEAGQLEKLINHFLSFAKPFEANINPCDPEETIARALQLCERLAGHAGVEMVARCAEGLPCLRADQAKIAQALANLVRNAIEVMAPGGRVEVAAHHEAEEMVFRIEDTGPGLRLQEGEDIFAPFFSKKEGGTGLGLSIVQRIIAAHKGKVSCGNRPEGGAYFELRIPLRPS